MTNLERAQAIVDATVDREEVEFYYYPELDEDGEETGFAKVVNIYSIPEGVNLYVYYPDTDERELV